ncbi:3-isopropylmalate dehydrogenase, chloroplastic-like [Senna tora]|uniref:3-isopropylmalate dehydrogenase, chloroplastic-like n=1 Tax=Senna tora TaxID=362788 RepID=A0A834TTW1_9FABA|nr:3-isopropylmalate dehydrogenase, chloroplastic-like [Senna tora]
MAASSSPSLQLNVRALRPFFETYRFLSTRSIRPSVVRCSAAAAASPSKRSYSITLLPGDGIGPEVTAIAKNVLVLAGSLEARMEHLEASVDTAVPTSRMDRIEASLVAIKKKVDALTHSIDCGLSPLDGLHKNVESTMPTDAPLPIVATDMEDSTMSKVLSQLESCEDEQDEVVCDSQIFDSYPTRPLMDEDKGLQIGVTADLENQEDCSVFVDVYGAGAYQVFDEMSDRDVGVQIVDASTEWEHLQGDANEVYKSKANVSLHHHVFSFFPSEFCKEGNSTCSAKFCYNDITLFDHIGEMHVEANTISELIFDPSGNYYMAHL